MPHRCRSGFIFVSLAALGAACAAEPAPRPVAPGLTLEQYRQRVDAALDVVGRRTPDQARRRIEFTGNLFFAHQVWVGAMPQEALLATVDAFADAGMDRVDINPGLYPWVDADQAVIAKYDAAVARIRARGMKLQINPEASSFRHKIASFAQWQQHSLVLFAELARRYRPDTFVVVHEPSTMAARIGESVSIAQWTEFARTLAAVVKENSPATRIGAGGLASERRYFEAFARMPEIDVLTLDVYGIRELETVNAMIATARRRGKPVYIEETWRPPFFQPEPGMTLESISMKNIGNAELAGLDARWLQVLARFAQANHLEAITPIWPWPLFKYVNGPGNIDEADYNRQVVAALLAGERTTTFRALQEVVRENRQLRR